MISAGQKVIQQWYRQKSWHQFPFQREMEAENERFHKPLIHHSDRGLQHCLSQYQHILSKNNIIPSMTDGYDCYQNALAEQINGILKAGFLIVKPANINQGRVMIEQAVKLYNERRPHLALNYQTPNIIHKQKVLASTS